MIDDDFWFWAEWAPLIGAISVLVGIPLFAFAEMSFLDWYYG